MKTEMAMLPNGNYERIVSAIQHQCYSENHRFECVEYGWDIGKLHLKIEDGDPYEDGYSCKIEVKYCPFCGYQPERTSEEDTVIPAFFGTKFCCGCKEENCVCDVPNHRTKAME